MSELSEATLMDGDKAALPSICKDAARSRRSGRIEYLDGLRGIAALGVALFAHYDHFGLASQSGFTMAQAPGYRLLAPLYGYTWTAVELFFVISGVVFARVYADRLPSALEFAKRRFARLYPLHLATLIVVAILVSMYQQRFGRAPVYQDNDAFHFVLNMFFIHFGVVSETYSFNGPSYSLAIEAIMYVLFYVAARFSNLEAISWFLCIGSMVYLALPHPWHHLPLVNNTVALGLAGFFGGVILAQAGKKTILVPLAAIALTPVSVNLFCKIYAVIFATMLIIGWSETMQKLLGTRVLAWLGDRSLSIYLIHFPLQLGIVLMLEPDLPYSSFGLLLGYGVALLTIAHLTRRFIEMPAQAWILSLGKNAVRKRRAAAG